MKQRTSITIIPVILAGLLLAACGGGSSAPTPSATQSHSLGCAHTFSAASMPASFAHTSMNGYGLHAPSAHMEHVAGGVVAVRFAGNSISSEAAAALARIGASRVSELNPQGSATFSIPSSADPRAVAASLRSIPGVASAGPVIYRHVESVIPDDPAFGNQWDFQITQMENAWMVTTGSTGIRIAVIDTGYDTANADLAGKVDGWVVFDLGNGTLHKGASIEDEDGHGSDVSGIAAADTNNNTYVAGVGWNTHLLEARVFPYGGADASTADIAAAVNWAVAAGARVINLSLGSGSPDPTYEEPAVAAAIKAGVIVVAAAGNESANSIDYPAADPGVIAVGASAFCDSTRNVVGGGYEYVAAYSNYGAGLTLVAPGGDPTKAQTNCSSISCVDFLQWIENLDSLSGKFKEPVGLFAGTSQASPHVAGAAALMLSKDPSLTPAQALAIFQSSSDSIADPHQGAGRLNVLNALNQTP